MSRPKTPCFVTELDFDKLNRKAELASKMQNITILKRKNDSIVNIKELNGNSSYKQSSQLNIIDSGRKLKTVAFDDVIEEQGTRSEIQYSVEEKAKIILPYLEPWLILIVIFVTIFIGNLALMN